MNKQVLRGHAHVIIRPLSVDIQQEIQSGVTSIDEDDIEHGSNAHRYIYKSKCIDDEFKEDEGS